MIFLVLNVSYRVASKVGVLQGDEIYRCITWLGFASTRGHRYRWQMRHPRILTMWLCIGSFHEIDIEIRGIFNVSLNQFPDFQSHAMRDSTCISPSEIPTLRSLSDANTFPETLQPISAPYVTWSGENGLICCQQPSILLLINFLTFIQGGYSWPITPDLLVRSKYSSHPRDAAHWTQPCFIVPCPLDLKTQADTPPINSLLC